MPGPLANPLAPPHSLCSSDKDHIRDTPPPGRCTAQQEISGSEKVGIEHFKCLQVLDFGELLWTQDFADHRDDCALGISEYVDWRISVVYLSWLPKPMLNWRSMCPRPSSLG